MYILIKINITVCSYTFHYISFKGILTYFDETIKNKAIECFPLWKSLKERV